MTRPTLCLRCSRAILSRSRANAATSPSRSLHLVAPLLAKTARAAPSVVRAQRKAKAIDLLSDRRSIDLARSEPLTDAAAQEFLRPIRLRDPQRLASLEHQLSRAIGLALTPRLLVFCFRLPEWLGELEVWSEKLQSKFEAERQWATLSATHIHELARLMTGKSNASRSARTGRTLLQCCSRAGHQDATLDLGISYQDAFKAGGSSAVTRAEYSMVREQVHDLAETGDVRASSLEAELVQLDQGPKAALPFWERAVRRACDQDPLQDTSPSRYLYLEKPWVWLASLKSSTFNDQQGANATLKLGMLRDDPDAYHAYARQNAGQPRDQIWDYLEWMNNVTKSAASGSFRSAIDLAHHYADEAFTDVSDASKASSPNSWWSSLVTWTKSPSLPQSVEHPPLTDYQYQVATYANAARSPEDRMQLAIKWLAVAAAQGSMDAHLDLAILKSRKFIFGVQNLSLPIKHPDEQRDTDVNAHVKMLYGHETDLAPAEPISSQTFASNTETPKTFVWRKGTPNPFYDLDAVKFHLETVASAHLFLREIKSQGVNDAVDDRERAPEWFAFPDVAELNEAHDDSNWTTAKRIADTMGIDISQTKGT